MGEALRRRPPAWALAAVLAVAYLVLQPPTADHAAQHYRASLGLAIWDGGWYAGHHLPAYSVLFPPLASVLGVRVTGALSAVAAAALFERLVRDRFPPTAAWISSFWFALGTAAGLVSGRLTFLLGVAVGLGALLAASRGRRAAAAVLAALTALASPVAATFVALAAAAWLVGTRPPGGRPGWRGPAGPAALALAALAPAVLLAYAFPEGGAFPFVASSFWPTVPAIVALALVLPRDQPVLRAGAALYVLALVASFVLSTPMGGNAARLGSLAAGPVAAAALWGRRPVALALLAVPLLWLQWGAAVDDWARAASDASVHRAYYDGLVGELRRRAGPPGASTGRLEVPFTDNHWESRWLAPNVPLARGWERQLDRERNALFYDDRPLTPARYRRWLDDHAVRWVALPDAPIDYSSAAEAQLVRDGLPYLREVWRDPHWRLFAVRDPAPVARGAARPAAATLGPQSVALRAGAAGTLDVRVRWSPYWFLERGRGCVAEGQGGWLRVALRAPGEVRLGMRFSPGRVGAAGARCTA